MIAKNDLFILKKKPEHRRVPRQNLTCRPIKTHQNIFHLHLSIYTKKKIGLFKYLAFIDFIKSDCLRDNV